jgi:hypothetical protein
MLLWRLRRAFYDPLLGTAWRTYAAWKRSPPFERASVPPRFVAPLANFMRGIGLVILPIGVILFGAPLFILLMFVTFTLAPILVPLAHMAYGSAIAFNVSGKIARERESSTYDLLSTLPLGGLGLHWTHAVSWMLDHRGWRDAAIFMMIVGITAAAFGVAVLFNTALESGTSTAAWLLSLTCVVLLILSDHVGTQITAALVSMIIPAYVVSAVNARVGAVIAFVGLQMTCYLVGALTASAILPAIYQLGAASEQTIAFTLPVFTLIAFVGVREFIARQLWRRFGQAINATPAELAELC